MNQFCAFHHNGCAHVVFVRDSTGQSISHVTPMHTRPDPQVQMMGYPPETMALVDKIVERAGIEVRHLSS